MPRKLDDAFKEADSRQGNLEPGNQSASGLRFTEQLLTLSQAAERLGLPIFKLRRAAKFGIFPTYTIANSRKLVRLSEVVAAIERSRTGGR